MKIKQIIFGLFIFSGIILLNSCTNPSEKNTKADSNEFHNEATLEVETIQGEEYIAIAAPLTGPYRELGKSIVEGATIAVKEYNDSVGNNKIGTIIIDDGGLVAEGLARADLIIEANALGVIGHLNSTVSVEASKKYSAKKIPQISPASTHPIFTERPEVKGYVFRTIGTDRQIGEAAAEYVLESDEFKKIAVLYNDKPYGISVASEFVRSLAQDQSKEIVFYETIPVRTTDHSPTATKVASKNPDLVFFVGEYNDAGYLLKELKKRLPELQFLGGEGIHNENFITIAGTDAEGAIVLGAQTLDGRAKDLYQQRYNKADLGFVKTSYDAAKILISAAEDSAFKGSQAAAKIIAQDSIFDPNGDLIKPEFKLYQVKDGKFTSK